MNKMIIAIVAGLVGIGIVVGIFATQIDILGFKNGNDELLEVYRNQISDIEQGISSLNNRISELEKSSEDLKKQMIEVEKESKLLASKLERMSDDIDDLEESQQKQVVQSYQLTVDVSRTEYRVGDSVFISGSGIPSKTVQIVLLDSDRVILSEISTVSDSSGKFNSVFQLSKSLSLGTYNIKFSQEGKVVEKSFRIVGDTGSSSTPTPSTSSQGGLSVQTDRTSYAKGDRVVISGKTIANVWIDLDIFSPSNVQLVRTATRSDASGNYNFVYNLDSNAATGRYEVKITYQNDQVSVKFDVGQGQSSGTSQNLLTIVTDKSQYVRGDIVKIEGRGIPETKVEIRVIPPSGDSFLLSSVFTNVGGSYSTLYVIKTDAVVGSWKIDAEQEGFKVTANISVLS